MDVGLWDLNVVFLGLIDNRKSTTGELALSLMLGGGQIGHCIIYQGAVGYGFNRQTTHFPTPKALILYYSAHSLEEFNPQLKTALKYPVLSNQF